MMRQHRHWLGCSRAPRPRRRTGDESTSDLLMTAARSMRRSFGEAMAEYDVTPSQARALRVVGGAGARSGSRCSPSGCGSRPVRRPRSSTPSRSGRSWRGSPTPPTGGPPAWCRPTPGPRCARSSTRPVVRRPSGDCRCSAPPTGPSWTGSCGWSSAEYSGVAVALGRVAGLAGAGAPVHGAVAAQAVAARSVRRGRLVGRGAGGSAWAGFGSASPGPAAAPGPGRSGRRRLVRTSPRASRAARRSCSSSTHPTNLGHGTDIARAPTPAAPVLLPAWLTPASDHPIAYTALQPGTPVQHQRRAAVRRGPRPCWSTSWSRCSTASWSRRPRRRAGFVDARPGRARSGPATSVTTALRGAGGRDLPEPRRVVAWSRSSRRGRWADRTRPDVRPRERCLGVTVRCGTSRHGKV